MMAACTQTFAVWRLFLNGCQMPVGAKALFLWKKTLTLGLDINAKGYGGEENKVSYRDTNI